MPLTSSQQAPVASSANSSTAPLASAATFTGEWVDVAAYSDMTVAVATDQDGSYSVQFSPDGTNVDSTLTRYYRTGQINAPHRFAIARRYVRVTFTNSSASAQTYLRLQTRLGATGDLNAPIDSTLSRDFDAIVTRPTDYRHETALGLRQGHAVWNKFGYNTDVDTAAPEVIASWGGTFAPMTTARTLSIVSTSGDDDDGGTGANSVVVYGIDANREAQVVTVTMNGTTPVVTTETWLGVNRIAIALAGSEQDNVGTITATATTDATTQAQMPAGEGTSQQCIFFTQAGHTALFEWLTIDGVRFGSGTEPVITIRGWVYSAVSNARYEVLRSIIDLGVDTHRDLAPPIPFPVGEKSAFWLEATTTRNDTNVAARFSLIEVKAASA